MADQTAPLAGDPDRACIGGKDEACKYAPVVVIAGDLACSYHVITVLKLRLAETHGPVEVVVTTNGPWAQTGRSDG